MRKLPAHKHLDKLNIPYEKAEFSPDIDKGAASVARALGYNERQMINMMFDVPLFLSHSGLYIALVTIFLLFLVFYNPRLMSQVIPRRSWQLSRPKRISRKRQSIWLGLPFILVLFVFPIYATFAFQARVVAKRASCRYGPMLSGSLFLQPVGLAGSELVDLLHVTPKQFVIPGSEGHPAYKDYFFHFRGFLIGTVFSVVMGLVAAGIVAIFR